MNTEQEPCWINTWFYWVAFEQVRSCSVFGTVRSTGSVLPVRMWVLVAVPRLCNICTGNDMAFGINIPLKRLPKWQLRNTSCNLISFRNVPVCTVQVRYRTFLILFCFFSARIFPAPKLRVKSTKDDKIEFVTDAGQVRDCYFIQHCVICRPSASTCRRMLGSNVATSALTVRCSNHSARSRPHSRINRTWQLIDSSNVNDIETKAQTLRYRSLLSERKQNVLIWSAYYRNESKTFWFGPKFFYCKQIVSVLAQMFWDEAKQFDLVCKLSEAK